MSFIYGIINFDKKPVERDQIDALGNSVKWDEFENKIQNFGCASLGISHHPRLKWEGDIFEKEHLIGVADIKLYNYDTELHDSAEGDIALFLKAYERWGNEWMLHVNGDFAIVLYDKLKNEAVMYRDHFGVRPLAYSFRNSQLIFASHEFGIAYSGLTEVKLSEKVLIQHFLRKRTIYPDTVFKSVHKIIPAHAYLFNTLKFTHCKIWDPGKILVNTTLTQDSTITTLNHLLLKAVKDRYDENLNTGVHVSGGIDSTGIASILADINTNRQNLTGYSWTPLEMETGFEGINEKELINDFYNDKKVHVKFVENKAEDDVTDWLIPEMEVMPVELQVMRMAYTDGISSIFSGWGGDEFVSLSNRGMLNYLFFGFHWSLLLKFLKKSGIRSSIMRVRCEILPLLIPFNLLSSFGNGSVKNNAFYLKKSIWLKYFRMIIKNNQNIFGFGNRYRFMLNLMGLLHLPERMESWAIFGERYGIKYKYPLLDKDLIEFWFSIPVTLTIHQWKSRYLYREALKGILTESVRLRTNKDEALFVSNAINNVISGLPYLADEYEKIPEEEHLNIFNHRKFRQLIREIRKRQLNFQGKKLEKYLYLTREFNRLSFYLKCYKLRLKLKR